MSASGDEVRRGARWDGARGLSRHRLLIELQRYIPSSVMIPQRRFDSLLEQAREHQRRSCLYHNTHSPFSLYADHACPRETFPSVTTLILAVHEDEVWDLQWSHDGRSLATASSDQTAIIWRIGPDDSPQGRECNPLQILRNHQEPVNGLAWSPDDEILVTCAERVIKMWKAQTGVCIKELSVHTDTVTALEWLPSGECFLSAGMDSRIITWDPQGNPKDAWPELPIRITDIAVAPDASRVVAVGVARQPISATTPTSSEGSAPPPGSSMHKFDKRILILDWKERSVEASITLDGLGEVTSCKVSPDSKFALISHGPDEVQLWDLDNRRLARKYTGQRQDKNVIRSCFGGIDGNFIVSGSEDGKVYVWHRDTGQLLETLGGHEQGSVNAVAWNPREPRMFASCSDDKTIHIWEASPPPSSLPSSPGVAETDSPQLSGKGKQRS